MNEQSFEERDILIRLRRHLAQTIDAAALLHDTDDVAGIEHVRENVDAAIVNLRRAVAAMEAAIAHREAERPPLHRSG